jgi:hypothetical protein
MAAGNLGLVLSAIKLLLEYPQRLGLLTACMFLLAALTIAARYTDIRFFHGETVDCDPATMKHFRAYALRMGVLASALYAVSIVLGLIRQTWNSEHGYRFF